MPPLVSVLMPVYNGERFLAAAIQSVLTQSFDQFEFVVVDDGSTDATPRMLADCSDPRLVIVRIEHAGLIAALNAGLARCGGEFVARMDADDVSHADRLTRQVEFLAADDQVDLVTCWSGVVDQRGDVMGRMEGGVTDDMLLALAGGNDVVHGSIMVRRASLPVPAYERPPEDYRLWVRMVRARRRFFVLPEILYYFREHGDRYSLTHSQSQARGIVDVQWPLLEECFATRDLADPAVRARLVCGYGRVAGAAYHIGDFAQGDAARRRFLDLAGRDWNGAVEPAVRHGIEAMIWGGCPWPQAWHLRWLEWRRRPGQWASCRNLLLTLPPVQKIRSLRRRD